MQFLNYTAGVVFIIGFGKHTTDRVFCFPPPFHDDILEIHNVHLFRLRLQGHLAQLVARTLRMNKEMREVVSSTLTVSIIFFELRIFLAQSFRNTYEKDYSRLQN